MPLITLSSLSELVRKTRRSYFDGYKLIVLQHMLEDTLLFLSNLSKVIDIIAVFQIPYSVDGEVIAKLRESKTKILSTDINNEARLKSELNEIFSKYKKEKFIIHEVGGYFSFLCKPENKSLSERVAGIVEDTTFGLRRYQSFKKWPFPVYHVAKSRLKKLEASEVGFSITHAVISDLNEVGILTKGRKVLVIGYGDIGSAAAKALRDNGFNVCVFDKQKTKMLLARFNGFEVGEKNSLLREAEIVIGATGEQTIGKKDIIKLRSGIIIGSGSSKQIEIDVSYIESNSSRKKKISDGIKKYTLKKGQDIYLLRDGFPVNFAYKSVPIQVLDLVMSEIYLCMLDLVKGPKSAGLITLDESKHEIIADLWLRKTNTFVG